MTHDTCSIIEIGTRKHEDKDEVNLKPKTQISFKFYEDSYQHLFIVELRTRNHEDKEKVNEVNLKLGTPHIF